MNNTKHPLANQVPQLGFTLIEVMIVVAIVGILAAIAIPNYQDYVRTSRRSDAINALGAASTLQERYRLNNSGYGTLAQAGIAGTSPDGYYTITVPSNSASAYTITATPNTKGNQNLDTTCASISIDQAGVFSPAVCAKR